MNNLKIPPIIESEYQELFDLVQNKSDAGTLTPKQVADFLHKDHQWLMNSIYSGSVPFAFGSNKGVGRGASCIHVLPFFAYMTQGVLFKSSERKERP